MKLTVRIENRIFEVEIDNLCDRPIIATVEGERFEVWPEEAAPAAITRPAAPRAAAPAAETRSAGETPAANAIHAPIPGVIIAINVAEGDQVEVGQELCVLEAMKMKNSIRAPRAGEIATIAVKEGMHVQHHDLLFEYAD